MNWNKLQEIWNVALETFKSGACDFDCPIHTLNTEIFLLEDVNLLFEYAG